jgi:hypothetical protein
MDMLDFNPGANQYQLDYGVPRIFHVLSSDFKIVLQFDKDHTLKKNTFGLINVSVLFPLFLYSFWYCG